MAPCLLRTPSPASETESGLEGCVRKPSLQRACHHGARPLCLCRGAAIGNAATDLPLKIKSKLLKLNTAGEKP